MKPIRKTQVFAWLWFSIILLSLYFLGYEFAFADESKYSPLVHLPGVDVNKVSSIPDLVNTIYKATLGIGALLGVIKIAFAGVKYSMSDIVTDKASAKTDVLGVLLGLAILLMPYVVLNTIYPDFLDLGFVKGIREQNLKLGTSTASGSLVNPNPVNPNPEPGQKYLSPFPCLGDNKGEGPCYAHCEEKMREDPEFLKVVDITVVSSENSTTAMTDWSCTGYYESSAPVPVDTKLDCPADVAHHPTSWPIMCKNWCEDEIEALPGFVSITSLKTSEEVRDDPENTIKVCDITYTRKPKLSD